MNEQLRQCTRYMKLSWMVFQCLICCNSRQNQPFNLKVHCKWRNRSSFILPFDKILEPEVAWEHKRIRELKAKLVSQLDGKVWSSIPAVHFSATYLDHSNTGKFIFVTLPTTDLLRRRIWKTMDDRSSAPTAAFENFEPADKLRMTTAVN